MIKNNQQIQQILQYTQQIFTNYLNLSSHSLQNTSKDTQKSSLNLLQTIDISQFTPQSISKLIFQEHLQEIKYQFDKLPNKQCKLEHFLIIMLKILFLNKEIFIQNQDKKLEIQTKMIIQQVKEIKRQGNKLKEDQYHKKNVHNNNQLLVKSKEKNNKNQNVNKQQNLSLIKQQQQMHNKSQQFDHYPFYLMGFKQMFQQISKSSLNNLKDSPLKTKDKTFLPYHQLSITYPQLQRFVLGQVILPKRQQQNTQFQIRFQQDKKQDFLLHDQGILKLIHSPSMKIFLCLDKKSNNLKIYNQEMKLKKFYMPDKAKHGRKQPIILDMWFSDFSGYIGIVLGDRTIEIVNLQAYLNRTQKQFQSLPSNLIITRIQSLIQLDQHQIQYQQISRIFYIQMSNKWLLIGQKNQFILLDISKYVCKQEQLIIEHNFIKNEKTQFQISNVIQLIPHSLVCIILGNQIWFFNQTLKKKKYKKYIHETNIVEVIYCQQKNMFYMFGKDQKFITRLKLIKNRDSLELLDVINFGRKIKGFQIYSIYNVIVIVDEKNQVKLIDQTTKKQYQVQDYSRIVKININNNGNKLQQQDNQRYNILSILSISKYSFILYHSYIVILSLNKVAIQSQIQYNILSYSYYDPSKYIIYFSLNNNILGISMTQGNVRQSYSWENVINIKETERLRYFWVMTNTNNNNYINDNNNYINDNNNYKKDNMYNKKPFILNYQNQIFDIFTNNQSQTTTNNQNNQINQITPQTKKYKKKIKIFNKNKSNQKSNNLHEHIQQQGQEEDIFFIHFIQQLNRVIIIGKGNNNNNKEYLQNKQKEINNIKEGKQTKQKLKANKNYNHNNNNKSNNNNNKNKSNNNNQIDHNLQQYNNNSQQLFLIQLYKKPSSPNIYNIINTTLLPRNLSIQSIKYSQNQKNIILLCIQQSKNIQNYKFNNNNSKQTFMKNQNIEEKQKQTNNKMQNKLNNMNFNKNNNIKSHINNKNVSTFSNISQTSINKVEIKLKNNSSKLIKSNTSSQQNNAQLYSSSFQFLLEFPINITQQMVQKLKQSQKYNEKLEQQQKQGLMLKITKFNFIKKSPNDKPQIIIKYQRIQIIITRQNNNKILVIYDILLTDDNTVHFIRRQKPIKSQKDNKQLNSLNQSLSYSYKYIKLSYFLTPKVRQTIKFTSFFINKINKTFKQEQFPITKQFFSKQNVKQNQQEYYSLIFTTEQGFILELIQFDYILKEWEKLGRKEDINDNNLSKSYIYSQNNKHKNQHQQFKKDNNITSNHKLAQYFQLPDLSQKHPKNSFKLSSFSQQFSIPFFTYTQPQKHINLMKAHNSKIQIIFKVWIQFQIIITVGKDGYVKAWKKLKNQKNTSQKESTSSSLQCIISMKLPNLKKQVFQVKQIQEIRTKRQINNLLSVIDRINKLLNQQSDKSQRQKKSLQKQKNRTKQKLQQTINIQKLKNINKLIYKAKNQEKNTVNNAKNPIMDKDNVIKIQIDSKEVQNMMNYQKDQQKEYYIHKVDDKNKNYFTLNNSRISHSSKDNNKTQTARTASMSLKYQKSFENLLEKAQQIQKNKSIQLPYEIMELRKPLIQKYLKKKNENNGIVLDIFEHNQINKNEKSQNQNIKTLNDRKNVNKSMVISKEKLQEIKDKYETIKSVKTQRNKINSLNLNKSLNIRQRQRQNLSEGNFLKNDRQELLILPQLKQYKVQDNYKSIGSLQGILSSYNSIEKTRAKRYSFMEEQRKSLSQYDSFQACAFVKNKLGPKKANQLDKIDKQFIRKEYTMLAKKNLAKRKQSVSISTKSKNFKKDQKDQEQVNDINYNLETILNDVRRIKYESKYGGQRHIPKVIFDRRHIQE